MLTRACEQHGIIREHRPKGQPNYGPHIERAFRTFMGECQSLLGTTFSNVQKKMKYDSEGHACMTLGELELWFTIFIVYCYHHRAHKGINDIPPIKLYHQFVHGSATQPGVGLPAAIEDEENFRLDFTPYVERTVQRDGVVIDHVKYYAPILRRWVDAPDQNDRTKARKFIFARDPRDISSVYFLDPEIGTYSRVPYFNSTRPAISLWELRAATARIKDDPKAAVDEEMIFKGMRLQGHGSTLTICVRTYHSFGTAALVSISTEYISLQDRGLTTLLACNINAKLYGKFFELIRKNSCILCICRYFDLPNYPALGQ